MYLVGIRLKLINSSGFWKIVLFNITKVLKGWRETIKNSRWFRKDFIKKRKNLGKIEKDSLNKLNKDKKNSSINLKWK